VDADPVTITIGVAVAPMDGSTLEVVLDTADQRMMIGKVDSRNRVYAPPAITETPNQPGEMDTAV
jgi:GGDEF domain-containing protein